MGTRFLRKKLQELRIAKGLSLDDLSKKTGSSKSYLWELENRENTNPSAEKLAKIAQVLDVTYEYLLDDSVDTPDDDVSKQVFFRKYDKLDLDTKKKLNDILDAWSKE